MEEFINRGLVTLTLARQIHPTGDCGNESNCRLFVV